MCILTSYYDEKKDRSGFFFIIDDNSMSNSGIFEGYFIHYRKCLLSEVNAGAIVVVSPKKSIDSKLTARTLYKADKDVLYVPSNRCFPFYDQNDVDFIGVVTRVVNMVIKGEWE